MFYYDPKKCVAYLENKEGRIAIEDEVWSKLKSGVNNEFKIGTGEDGLPTLVKRKITDEEIARENIWRCYRFLARTDWIDNKKNVMEDAEWQEKYKSIIEDRATARAKINELETLYPEFKQAEQKLTLR